MAKSRRSQSTAESIDSTVKQGEEPTQAVLPHGTTAFTGLKRKVNILVIGDLFSERYWAPHTASKDPPITSPEPMRSHTAVRERTIRSGVHLHNSILKKMLELMIIRLGKEKPDGFDADKCSFTVAGSDKSELTDKIWQGFSTYLHQLGPYPIKESSPRDNRRVWRIAETLGLHESTTDEGEEFDEDGHTAEDQVEIANKYENTNVAETALDNMIAAATTAVKQMDPLNGDSLILVINDRNHKFRDRTEKIDSLFKEIATRFSINQCPPNNLVIIWHVRQPSDRNSANTLAELLSNSVLRHNTIVIINHECLRDQGVNIRFDVSYEHTMRDVVDFSLRHPLLMDLLKFPQVLIRFDYGVLHLTTDQIENHDEGRKSQDHRDFRIIAMDVHGMVGGPFYIARKKYGMMTGRTFLLVASLVREITRWHFVSPKTSFGDLFRMEGIESRDTATRLATPNTKLMELNSPAGNVKLPSILRSTLFDIAIDLGILLNAYHFYNGYGDFCAGELPLGIDKPTSHFKLLFEEFYPRVEYSIRGIVDSQKLNACYEFFFDHVEPKLTRLARFSIDPGLLEVSEEVVEARKTFSRVKLLGQPSLMSLASAPGIAASAPEKISSEFEWRRFEQSLQRIVTHGIEAVVGRRPRGDRYPEPSILVPFVQMGSRMVVLDRDEIDGFLSIRFLLESYLSQATARSQPLSIGVFGPPGTGKSYVVKEILRSVGKNPETESLTINLSQFTSVDELAIAFHRIQDRALANQIPIAFFDEFDCSYDKEPLGWLKYFLAPMQDGEFFDGDDTFHVGPAIFVFGGGTAPKFSVFVDQYRKEVSRKAPDFISRLRGHVDIQDISVLDRSNLDERLKVRRALLLRSLLEQKAKTIFDSTGEVAKVDNAIVSAFLRVLGFEHGTRSMEAIISMARIGDVGTFQKSSLPTPAQLQMHVDAADFELLINQP